MGIPINPRITFADGVKQYWVVCPGCGTMGKVDKDQVEGKVSIVCPECEYHETHDLRPLFESYEAQKQKLSNQGEKS